MIPRSARFARAWLAASAIALAVLILMPVGAALAHASLVSSDPADGTTLTASPASISATFAEAFDTGRSSMELLGPDGATLATNAAAAAATAESMTISGYATLAPGVYSVRWTTITPDDNGIERGTFRFTMAAPVEGSGQAGSASPGAVATPIASPGAAAGGSSGGSGDIAVALVVLAALVIAGLAWFLRRSR
jgi:methionine-rich copper-binding protein CopC